MPRGLSHSGCRPWPIVLAIDTRGLDRVDLRGGGIGACMLLVLEACGSFRRVRHCSAFLPPLRRHRDTLGWEQERDPEKFQGRSAP